MPNQDKIKQAFSKVKEDISFMQSQISLLANQIQELKRTFQQTDTDASQTNKWIIPTVPQEEKGLKHQISKISIGNDGVPTDRQTNRQTDQHIGNRGVETLRMEPKEDKISHLERVSEVLNSLDTIKKEIRTKFKHLTIQEMTVFSTIYELEDKGFIVDYSLISSKLDLSESSIRDYVQKIIKKGIPITKTKENNKKILVSIDPNLKKIASLETINLLRGL